MGRFARSWSLIKYSASVLNQDRELLVFPLISSVVAIAVVISFIPALALLPEMDDDVFSMALMGAIYLIEYFVIFFFNSALVGAALMRMNGDDPTVMDGLRIAGSRAGKILGYALIAATVGVLLRAISERVGLIGQLVVSLIGVAWTAASFLTVPVLVSRDIGPVDAVQESARLLKTTWGENIISTGGIGLVFTVAYAAIIGGAMFIAFGSVEGASVEFPVTIIIVAVVICMLLGLFQAALQGIFSAALYSYAVGGDSARPSAEIGHAEVRSEDLLANAFRPK